MLDNFEGDDAGTLQTAVCWVHLAWGERSVSAEQGLEALVQLVAVGWSFVSNAKSRYVNIGSLPGWATAVTHQHDK